MSAGDSFLKWKQRAEQAEATVDALKNEVHGLMNSRGDWQARAEHAEKERTALQRHYDAAGPEHNLLALLDLYDERRTDAMARAERAEADNAALLRDSIAGLAMFHATTCEMASGIRPENPGECTDVRCREWHARIMADHPGAALLERMRALEEVLSVALEMDAGDTCSANWTRLHEACAAVDALKERTP